MRADYKPRPLKFAFQTTTEEVHATVVSEGGHKSSVRIVLRVDHEGRSYVHVSTDSPVRIRGRYIIFNGDAGCDEAPPSYIRSVEDVRGSVIDWKNPPTYRMERDISATIDAIGAAVLADPGVLRVLLNAVFRKLQEEATNTYKGRQTVMAAVSRITAVYGNDIPRVQNRIRSALAGGVTLESAVECAKELGSIHDRIKMARAVI